MVVEAGRLPVELLADAAVEVAAAADLRAALAAIVLVAARSTDSDLAVLRLLGADGDLAARAVAPEGSPLGAEVAGTRSPGESIAAGETSEAVSRAAERAGAAGVLVIPAYAGGRLVGSVELLRIASPRTNAPSQTSSRLSWRSRSGRLLRTAGRSLQAVASNGWSWRGRRSLPVSMAGGPRKGRFGSRPRRRARAPVRSGGSQRRASRSSWRLSVPSIPPTASRRSS
jgi:hypothetical protein